jgi:hypothetical protein
MEPRNHDNTSTLHLNFRFAGGAEEKGVESVVHGQEMFHLLFIHSVIYWLVEIPSPETVVSGSLNTQVPRNVCCPILLRSVEPGVGNRRSPYPPLAVWNCAPSFMIRTTGPLPTYSTSITEVWKTRFCNHATTG